MADVGSTGYRGDQTFLSAQIISIITADEYHKEDSG
jgi:hypothetical protein